MGSEGLSGAGYTATYAYDTFDRLTSTSVLNSSGTALSTAAQGSYTYGASGHLHAVSSVGTGSTGYIATYDAAGNMFCRAPTTTAGACTTSSQTGQPLSYDTEGRLTHWQNLPGASPTSTAAFAYDGEGQRVAYQTVSGSTTTTTLYLGGLEEVATTTTTGTGGTCTTFCCPDCGGGGTTTTTTLTKYLSVPGVVTAERVGTGGPLSYLATDGLGSVSAALDSSGTLTATQLFAPYGSVRYSTGTMPTAKGYTGQRQDAASGLDYYNARYYDPALGQFTSADTVLPGDGSNPWGLSRYAYVEGNPIARNDPSGHCAFICTMIVGAVVGAAISAGSQIVSSMQKGQSFGDAVKSVDLHEVGKAALVGAVIGATGFAATSLLTGGAASAGLLGAGASAGTKLAVQFGIKVAGGAVEGAAGQIIDNVRNGRHWSDDLGSAALFGAGTAGITEVGSAGLRRFVGRYVTAGVRVRAAAEIDNSLADGHIARSFGKRSWTRDEVLDTIQNGRAQRTADIAAGGRAHPEPATRFTNPASGRGVTVNNATGRIRQLGGRGFRYDFYDHIARGRGWW